MYPQWIISNKENYKFFLKKYSCYSISAPIWQEKVVYENINKSQNLNQLLKCFNLNRLKQDNELQTCMKAMEWTFYQLFSYKQLEYEDELNALKIIEFCKRQHVTVNCLCHATVLTEVLLALGFKARKISCMPIDIVPYDNHVVVAVFLLTLNKWIMLDPSMCCYVTDQENNILSISEIRNHLIQDKALKVCTHNRFIKSGVPTIERFMLNQEDYLAYLYKNFFRFLSRRIQGSNPTHENDVFYMLVPNNYLIPNTEQSNFIEGANVAIRLVNNEQFFWQQ